MTRLHLPSLQAAAALASATPKDKAPLRLIQVIRSRSGGQAYLATCDGKLAIRCEHPCREVVRGTTIGMEPVMGEVPIEGTELPKDRVLLIWADSVPKKKPTKAEMDAGCWVDLEGSGIVHWVVEPGTRRLNLTQQRIPGDPHTTYLDGVPDLAQLEGLREFIPGNCAAGCTARVGANYLGLLTKAAESMARGYSYRGTYGQMYGDNAAIEFYTPILREGKPIQVDLTAQRWDAVGAPTAWGLLMPIQRMHKDAIRGNRLVEEVAA